MNYLIQQIGLSTATNRRRHSYANVDGCGSALLRGEFYLPAQLAFVGGEPMT